MFLPRMEILRWFFKSKMQHSNRILILISFFIPVILAGLGGISLFFESPGFEKFGLDWDYSSSHEKFPLWVRLCWPVLILITPLVAFNGFAGVLLYCFADLSIQGSEVAARCAHRDGFLDWFLLSLVSCFLLGKLSKRVEAFRSRKPTTHFLIGRILLHPSFVLLALFVSWVFLSSWVSNSLGWSQETFFYRRPILWLHCLSVFYIAASELHNTANRIAFLGFLAFTLVWRVTASTHSVWLEGHFASFLVIVLPWMLFAIQRSEFGRVKLLSLGYFLLIVIWCMGPSLDGKRGYLANETGDRFGMVGFCTPIVLIMLFFALSLWKNIDFLYFVLASILAVVGILMISNRAAALSGGLCLVLSALCYPLRYYIRLAVMGIALFVATLGAFYKPLASRFHDIATSGSGKERLELWRIALELFDENRWLGVGSGRFPSYVPLRSTEVRYPLDVHNTLLEVLCENGLPGAVLFLLFWLSLLVFSFVSFLNEVRKQPQSSVHAHSKYSLLRLTWVHRASWVFITLYFAVGLFGSRHNLPLAYLLAGLSLSVCTSDNEEELS
jgi:O-antigen ligase